MAGNTDKTFLEYFNEGKWDEANRALSGTNDLCELVCAVERMRCRTSIPPTLIENIYAKAKYICDSPEDYRLKSFTVGHFGGFLAEAPVETVTVLLREIATMCQFKGEKPFCSMRHEIIRDVRSVWIIYLRNERREGLWDVKTTSKDALMSVSSIADLDNHPELSSLWLRTETLLKAATTKDGNNPMEDGQDWFIVHAIAESNCHIILLWFALKLYPNQIQRRDSKGNLPLHYVAQHGHAPKWLLNFDFLRELREVNLSMTRFLLRRFPEGSRYANCECRLPLSLQFTGSWKNHDEVSVIKALVAAAPQALIARDPVTRLYPYQAAAAHDAELETIYMLLVSNPAAIGFRKPTACEKDYERALQEISKLERQNKRLREELDEYRQENEWLKRESGSDVVRGKRLRDDSNSDAPDAGTC